MARGVIISAPMRPSPRLLLYYPPKLGMDRFQPAFAAGKRPEASHWSMHLAAEHGFDIESTVDGSSERLFQLTTKATFIPLRFHLAHAFSNQALLRHADVIWAMSERELIPALLYRMLLPEHHRPLICGDLVWLLDEWDGYLEPRRAFLRWLLPKADLLLGTTESMRRDVAAILPGVTLEPYRFGVPIERFRDIRPEPGPAPGIETGRPVHVLSLGNDNRRDWQGVAEAFADDPRFAVRVVSGQSPEDLVMLSRRSNVELMPGTDFTGLRAHYAWADIVVLPQKPNRHAAGLTTALEAVAAGIPLAITATPGMDEYFSDRNVALLGPHDVAGMREAALRVRADPAGTAERAGRALARMRALGCDSAQVTARRCAAIQRMVGMTVSTPLGSATGPVA